MSGRRRFKQWRVNLETMAGGKGLGDRSEK